MTARSRTDIIWASLTGGAALALFVATLQPGFGGPEDTPKFQFLGYVLGTAHPPGYPLYVLLSNLFVRLPIRTIAYRANLFSAVTAAVACALVYVIARQLGSGRWPACTAALGLATGASFWLSAVYAEVYGLAALMAALTMTLFLDWRARGGAGRLLLSLAAFSAGMGNHLTLIGIVPACLLYVVLRDRRVLTPRVVAAAAGLLLLGAAQYGLIILRTHQGAPYLESEAHSLSELATVMTAQRFADKRFAFTASQVLTDHLPATLRVIDGELGGAGLLMLAAGCIAAVGARSAPAAVVAGAGAGMFVMVLNLQGDLKGFITPVMVFVWPFAALGVTALAEWLGTWRLDRRGVGVIAFAAATAMPAANVRANYRDADRSRDTDAARFHTAMFAQLPDRAAFVIEDYASNMALCYYLFTGEAGPSRGIARVGFDGVQVREAGRTRPVFAFARAAGFLQAQGLHFERWDVVAPPSSPLFPELVYELQGQNSCATVSADVWTDVTPAFSTGSWIAAVNKMGSVTIETVLGDPDVRVDTRELFGGGMVQTEGPSRNSDGTATLVTQLTRKDGPRPVFRLALDRLPASARARLKPGAISPSITLCADTPLNPLFRDAGSVTVLRPDFESEPYFGAGWSEVERTATGRVRRGSTGAALLLPLASGFNYRLSLDITTARPATADVSVNDVSAGTCAIGEREPCEVDLPAAALREGVNVVKLSVRPSQGNGAILTFYGARLERRRSG